MSAPDCNPLLAAALAGADRGWSMLALCPPGADEHRHTTAQHQEDCRSPGKVPHGKEFAYWKPCHSKPAVKAKLCRAWEEHPASNVGMATGPVSGLVGLDIEGKEAEAFLDQLEHEHAPLPTTQEFDTAKGRRPLYAWPQGVAEIPNHTWTFADGEIRVLAKGRQTVMPPSIHESGFVYKWREGLGPGETKPAPCPEWLVKVIQEAHAAKKAAADDRPHAQAPQPDAKTAEVIDRARAYLKQMGECHPEADHPMDASTHLLKGANAVAIGFDLDDATCVSLLAEWDVLNAVRPYPVKELERKVREARAHPHWPKGYPHVFGYLLAKSEQTPRSKHSTTGAPKGGEPGAESPASDAEPAENAGDETPEQITRFRWNPIDSATFATGNYRPHWLVERLLVQGQPGVIGGPQKSLKTTLMIALAISMASGKPFLGVFKVYKPCRVAVISGESGEYVLQETAQRICHALGVNLADLGIKWLFRLPQMGSLADLTALQAGLKRDGIEVVFIDPLYLSLLTGEGAKGKEASNLFDTGPLLMKVGQLCLSAGATPIPCHHTGKPLAKSREPLELSDLAYSGIAEYARQWLLTSRKERFKPDTGKHKLWLVGGGCAGQSGCWEVDVDEGRLRNDFTGRIWEVTVTPASEAREDDAKVADDSKDRAKAAEVRKDAAKVLAILKQEDPQSLGFGCTTARALASLSGDRMTRAVAKLVADQLVEEFDLPCDMPKGGTKGKRGIRWLKNP